MTEAQDISELEQNESAAKELKKLIRAKVESTIVKSARLEDSKIIEVENLDDYVYGHWMAFILISGSSVRTMLKVHFNGSTARAMLGTKVRRVKDPKALERMAMDFMKEQCNLMAGALKTAFNSAQIITGLSIPLVTRGFDEAVFSDKVDHSKINDVWKLSWPDGEIVCSSVTEVLQWGDFSSYVYEEEEEEEDGVFL
ncbi:MAG: hypothetical protein HRU19_24195 [Pseudobacteriovorax sp.]|nr:hypothetical protein [Pseudobacteriovorax sp.]